MSGIDSVYHRVAARRGGHGRRMLDTLTGRLSRIVKTIRGEARLTESNVQDALREVRIALLEADCALPVVQGFHRRGAREGARRGGDRQPHARPGAGRGGAPRAHAPDGRGERRAGPRDAAARGASSWPGLQGSGKTTTTGKLARWLIEKRKRVLVVSCDVYRPAAIEQLKTVAAQARGRLPADRRRTKPPAGDRAAGRSSTPRRATSTC